MQLLVEAYPHHDWKYFKFKLDSQFKSKGQLFLYNLLRSMLPEDTEIFYNYHDNSLVYSDTNKSVELDIYVPKYSLALEYQGKQHYHQHPLFDAFSDGVARRDEEKTKLCEIKGIKLLKIPYWWDFSLESLAATIAMVYKKIVENLALMKFLRFVLKQLNIFQRENLYQCQIRLKREVGIRTTVKY
jgi:hypothetical protein